MDLKGSRAGPCKGIDVLRLSQYRIEFFEGSNIVVRETHVFAGSPADAFLLVTATDWPPHTITARVIDTYGRCCLRVPTLSDREDAKREARRQPQMNASNNE